MRAILTLELGFAAPHVIDLEPTRVLRLGRNRTNDVVLHDQHASRWHAELYFENSAWVVRDLGTTNGTKINGSRIPDPVPIEHGSLIGIGEVRLRFSLLDPAEASTPTPVPAVHAAYLTGPNETTTFERDELTALFDFMRLAVHESTPRGLVTLALRAVREQVHAAFCGYVSLDRLDPLPHILVPAEATVDGQLSQELSLTAQRTRQTVWLDSPLLASDLSSKSLIGIVDAVCVPLLAGASAGRGNDDAELLGLLHVYSLTRPFTEHQVRFCDVLTGCLANNLRVLRSRRNLEADNQRFRAGVRNATRSEELVGGSPVMRKLHDEIRRLADKPVTVLIHGESGAGKELVALALHRLGRRGKGPFIEVNCAAIPRELAESQFFGHKRGSFTGATGNHVGHFQRADEGTLFLDEVGDMPLELQGKLLKVLDDGCFTPVGAEDPVKVEVRILAATHRDLRAEVRAGRFRHDLFFRLGGDGLTIEVPPLRDHPQDIPDIATHFLGKLCAEYRRKVSLTDAAVERLQAFTWPGNVRQLRAVLERALAMTDGGSIEPDDLVLPEDPFQPAEADAEAAKTLPTVNLAKLEELAIIAALAHTRNNKTQAALLLGMHRDTLTTKLKEYKLRDEG
jgi:DNA-binding NtrC family response regulator